MNGSLTRSSFPTLLLAATLVGASASTVAATGAGDPLPSWNDGAAKQAIVDFVTRVTTSGSPGFVPEAERIATFDNDGTLWSEQPMYVQAFFALDRVKALAPDHPEWKEKEPFASLLKGDLKGIAAGGEKGIAELLAATHSGVTTEEFENRVADWIATAKHPKTGRLFTQMVYQPMLELLAYLQANGFKNFIVSGGGIEFMRPWTERVYGIPPERVIGSSASAACRSPASSSLAAVVRSATDAWAAIALPASNRKAMSPSTMTSDWPSSSR